MQKNKNFKIKELYFKKYFYDTVLLFIFYSNKFKNKTRQIIYNFVKYIL